MLGRTPADQLAAALDAYRKDYEARKRSEPNPDAERAKQLVEKARELVRGGGLDRALMDLVDEVKYWPSWSKRNDFAKWVVFPVSDVMASEERLQGQYERKVITTVYFVYKGKRYGVILTDNGTFTLPDGDGYQSGTAEFIADDVVVLGLNVSNEHDEYSSRWRSHDVHALEIGPWTRALAEIGADIKLGKERARAESDATRAVEQARNIRL